MIDALCGSFARNEEDEHSDIDLLYHVEKPFLDLHGGFDSFRELKRIKEYLQNRLNRPVDLIPMNNLSDTAKHYIVQEYIDVR
ncbi:nucleotidyltransferase family protein [Nitratifractor sp.]